jgi:hypothetical protein
MKKILAIIVGFFLLCPIVNAQTSQNTTAFIYRPSIASTNGSGTGTAITNGTANTQSVLDNTTFIATDAFVNTEILRYHATIPLNITGGTYNFQPLGTGLLPVAFVSGGAVMYFSFIVSPGSGYAVGDVVALNGGNNDAIVVVNTIGPGGTVPSPSDLTVLYGGTGYTGGLQMPVTPSQISAGNTITLTGTLTSNALFILGSSTYLTSSNQLIVNNNTTGAYTVQFKISNGSDGSTGVGVYVPQGTNNSCAASLQKDGVHDVWLAAPITCDVAPNYFSGTSGSIGGSVLAVGACTTGTVSITGSTTAMGVVVTPSAYPGDGMWWDGYVSTPGTVTVRVCAAIHGTPTAETYNVRVLQ